MPKLVTTRDELAAEMHDAWQAERRIGLVPTMGALHAGHLSLVRASRDECGFTVVTIFVNPTQFAPHEDFAKYPRTLEADLSLLDTEGADLVFAPSTDEVYRPGHATFVEVGAVAEPFEGAIRRGHFRGVATVVLKLFNLIPADMAFFGQKDYQQALVIRRMVADLDVPHEIRVCPIVREPDGLAMSSRNVYLSPVERKHALVLSRSLKMASALAASGERNAAEIGRQMRQLIEAEPGVELEYAAVVNAETLADVVDVAGPTVALVAAKVGKARLIDNEILIPA